MVHWIRMRRYQGEKDAKTGRQSARAIKGCTGGPSHQSLVTSHWSWLYWLVSFLLLPWEMKTRRDWASECLLSHQIHSGRVMKEISTKNLSSPLLHLLVLLLRFTIFHPNRGPVDGLCGQMTWSIHCLADLAESRFRCISFFPTTFSPSSFSCNKFDSLLT